MITIVINEKADKISEIVTDMLSKIGNTNIDIVKQGSVIKILEKQDLRDMVSLEEKIIELEEILYREKQGQLYKRVLEKIERPLIEQVLMRVDGNQYKAARILGINRNTMHAKIKKLGINPNAYKQ